ncbi:MAG: SMP-30/gluconolactonase/LRE family protein [Phycisphaerales bacterium]|nr:SMP-30/gluconolactonase/LRE family protein [Phycisphaerales bacterium]
MMTVTAHDSSFHDLIRPAARLTVHGTGYGYAEGPVWHPVEQYLVFSDIIGSTRHVYVPGEDVQQVRDLTNNANGLTLDRDLNLVICEHGTSTLVRERPEGTREVLASHFEGSELNSPNDVVVRRDGTIYFSDPDYGRTAPGFGPPRDCPLGFRGVYRLSGEGELVLCVERDRYGQPNGLCFSPDESLLYINDSPNALIDVYEVAADGSLSGRRRLVAGIGDGDMTKGIPDGMKCDERGNIWVTGPGGVWVFSPEGTHLGTVHVPEVVGNLHWGGPDWRTLFIPSTTSLYSIPVTVGPHREPFMDVS